MSLVYTALHYRLRLAELHAVVYSSYLVIVLYRIAAYLFAVASKYRKRVREVILALRIVRRELVERPCKLCTVKHVHTGVDLPDLFLFLARVLLLNYPQHTAVFTANDPSVAGGVLKLRRYNGRTVALCFMVLYRLFYGFCLYERRVAVKHHNAPGRAFYILCSLHYRMTGAKLFRLDHSFGAFTYYGSHSFRLMSYYCDHRIRPCLTRSVDHPLDQLLAANLMNDLRHIRLHPCSHARCQNNTCKHISSIPFPPAKYRLLFVL